MATVANVDDTAGFMAAARALREQQASEAAAAVAATTTNGDAFDAAVGFSGIPMGDSDALGKSSQIKSKYMLTARRRRSRRGPRVDSACRRREQNS